MRLRGLPLLFGAAAVWLLMGNGAAWADSAPVVPSPVVMPWGTGPAAAPVQAEVLPNVVPDTKTVSGLAAEKAKGMLGVPYAWGGGTVDGSSLGVKQGAGTDGFDCSGLVTWAYAQAGLDWSKLDSYHIKKWGRLDAQMIFAVSRPLGRDPAKFKPGDPLFFGTPGAMHHIGLYLGRQNGRYLMVDAPHTGASVRIEPFLNWPDFYGGGRLPGAQAQAGTALSPADLVLPWGNNHPKPSKPNRGNLPDVAPPPVKKQPAVKPPAAQPAVPSGPPGPDEAVPVTPTQADPAPTTPATPAAEAAAPAVVTPWGSGDSVSPSVQPAEVVPAAPSDIQTVAPVAPSSGNESAGSFSQQVWQDDYDKAIAQGWQGFVSDAVTQILVPLGITQQDGENIAYGILSEESHSTNEYGDGGHGRGPMQVDDRTVPQWVLDMHARGLDVEWNIHEGVRILSFKIQYFLDQGFALQDAVHYGIAAYNAGQGAVASVLPGDPDSVTANGHYSAYVLGDQQYLESQGH